MPINIPPLITNTGNEQSLFGSGGSAPSAGVSSVNLITGNVLIASIDNSVSAISDGSQTVNLSTTGLNQVPASVASIGAISGLKFTTTGATVGASGSVSALTVNAGAFVGGGLGTTLPTTPAGTSTSAVSVGVSSQNLNIVLGNTRFQCGSINIASNAGSATITFNTPFVGIPNGWATPAGQVDVWIGTLNNTSMIISITNPSPANTISWLAIGPA
jgi:hypothetical protein